MSLVQTNPNIPLPNIISKGIYEDKIKDRSPSLRAAGKLTATGDTASGCMKPGERPPSPEVIRKFRATVRPDAGRKRVFYGKAYDPHRVWAEEMTHGVPAQPSVMAGELLNPYPNSLFRQRLMDKKESIYASHINGPLGKSHDQTPGLPSHLDKNRFTFGIRTEKDGSAGELVSPNKTRAQVSKESESGLHLYKITHADFLPGEQKDRNYIHGSFRKDLKYGIPTPHDNAGKHVRQTLKWVHDDRCERMAPIVSKRVDDFRERTQPQLGKVHDPIKDTLNVGPDHIFGILIKPDEYGAGDLLHGRGPGQYLRGKDRPRGLIAAMRQHLKKANYHNFDDLMAAFRHYDKNNEGTISMSDLREQCLQFNLPIEHALLEQMMQYCDANGDGRIDYIEFVNFLNWKDKMPSGLPPRYVASAPADMRLEKQIDSSLGHNRTSSSMINATVGGISTRDFRSYGVPTIRTDLPAPRIKRVSDHTNYGDESDAYGLVNPSLYSNVGVYERDFLQPRTKYQIREIFLNIGLQLDYDTFDRLYDVAASRHPRGLVSVESFRGVLDEAQARSLKNTPVL